MFLAPTNTLFVDKLLTDGSWWVTPFSFTHEHIVRM